jgi:hypothetical protein
MTDSNTNKPRCKLIGKDGNVFNLIGLAAKTLEKAGLREEAKDLQVKVFDCDSYDSALRLIGQYVEIY